MEFWASPVISSLVAATAVIWTSTLARKTQKDLINLQNDQNKKHHEELELMKAQFAKSQIDDEKKELWERKRVAAEMALNILNDVAIFTLKDPQGTDDERFEYTRKLLELKKVTPLCGILGDEFASAVDSYMFFVEYLASNAGGYSLEQIDKSMGAKYNLFDGEDVDSDILHERIDPNPKNANLKEEREGLLAEAAVQKQKAYEAIRVSLGTIL